ncbi:MAG: GAF domain-containing protein [Desulfotomaculales bacterium]
MTHQLAPNVLDYSNCPGTLEGILPSEKSLTQYMTVCREFFHASAAFLFYRKVGDSIWTGLLVDKLDKGRLVLVETGCELDQLLGRLAERDLESINELETALAGFCQNPVSFFLVEHLGRTGVAEIVLAVAVPPQESINLVGYEKFLFLAEGALALVAVHVLEAGVVKARTELNAMIQIGQAITSTSDLEVVLRRIIEKLQDIIDAESGGVLLYDPLTNSLVLQKPAFGLANEQFKAYTLSVNGEKAGVGVAVEVFRTGRPYICNQVELDRVTNQSIARMYGVRNSLTVPLVVDNRRIGVLHLINKKHGDFTPTDASLLSLLASQLAVFIENARLFSQLETKNKLLKRAIDIHTQLTDLVLQGKDLTAIAVTLAKLVERPVVVEDKFFHTLASACIKEKDAGKLLTLSGEMLENPRFQQFIKKLENERRPMVWGQQEGQEKAGSRLMAPIIAGDAVLGYISIIEGNETLEELDVIAVEHAATVFALKLMQQRIALEVEERIKGEFLDDLLNATSRSAEEIVRRAEYLGCDFKKPYQVMVIDIDNFDRFGEARQGDERATAGLKRRFFECINRTVAAELPRSIVGMKSGTAVVLVEATRKRGRATPALTLAGQIKQQLRLTLPETAVLIGIGRVATGVEELQISYVEAKRAIGIAKQFGWFNEVIPYDSLGAYKLLFRIEEKNHLKAFAEEVLGPLIQYDREKGGNLLKTLRVYLEHNCNCRHAADALFVHLNTFKYRLKRIAEIGGINLNDAEQRLNVHLALKILEIGNL